MKCAVAAAAVALFAECATMGETSAEDFAATVRSTWDDYESFMVAGDTESWIALWDEDGVQLPPNAPMVVGKPAIKEAIDAPYAALDWREFDIQITGTFVDHDYGFAYGTYAYVLQPRDGGPQVHGEGKYQTIFKRQPNGSWKIFRDCFDSNLPA